MTLKPEKLVAEILDDAADACHKLLYNELWLNDFTLRRAKFLEQSRDGHVLLWVVVSITISGVALAALQLAASYQLALSGRQDLDQPSELILEKSRISLKSSVTGLFILLISFAFFALFVNEIYRIKELRIGPSTNEVAQKNDEPQQIDAQPIEQITVPRSR